MTSGLKVGRCTESPHSMKESHLHMRECRDLLVTLWLTGQMPGSVFAACFCRWVCRLHDTDWSSPVRQQDDRSRGAESGHRQPVRFDRLRVGVSHLSIVCKAHSSSMLMDFVDELRKVGHGPDAVQTVLSRRDARRLTGRQVSSTKSRLVVHPSKPSYLIFRLCNAPVYVDLVPSVAMHSFFPIDQESPGDWSPILRP